MTITSVGYPGTITDTNWRIMATATVGALYGVDDFGSFRVTAGVGDRALAISTGGAFGLGVRDYSDAPILLTGAPVASGSRWDMVVIRRNWGAETSTPMLITGTSAKALPSRNTGFDGLNDQPLALVRFAAGQTAVQEIVDLRCIPADGGLVAFDPLVRSYLDRVGTQIRIGDALWTRSVDAMGSPTWLYQDVTPDTGWVDVIRNTGWSWGPAGHARRVGGIIFLRLTAERRIGWSVANGLAQISGPFRPDAAWYVISTSTVGKTEFVVQPDGNVNASQDSGGSTGVTIHTSYPAPRPI